MQVEPSPTIEFTNVIQLFREYGPWALYILLWKGPLRLEREIKREQEALQKMQRELEEWKALALGHAKLTKYVITGSEE